MRTRHRESNILPVPSPQAIGTFPPANVEDHVRAIDRLLPAGTDASWASYDGAFYRWLRWPPIVLMAARTALYALAAFRERLRVPTETLRGGLWIAFVGLLYWAMFGWHIFASPLTNLGFKAWLSVFLLVNTLQIVVWLRRTLKRVRVPKSLVGKP